MHIHAYQTQLKDPSWSDYGWYVAAFESPRENRAEITSWCYKTYGPPGFNQLAHETRWKDSIRFGEIYFGREQDLTLFLLRWS